jgi:hypothetical protein
MQSDTLVAGPDFTVCIFAPMCSNVWGVLRCVETGQRYVLKADEIRIGRDRSCQIQLPVSLTLASKVME